MYRESGTTRWAAVIGVLSGAVSLLNAGCRSVDPETPVTQQAVSAYSGLAATTSLLTTSDNNLKTVSHTKETNAPALLMTDATIDLEVSLRLAGADNPTINLARERVNEALADQLAARSLLLPSVNVGGNYRRHQGAVQGDAGIIQPSNLQSLDLGLGTSIIGSGTAAIPGVRLFAHLGDAAYEPLAARQRVTARGSDARAVQNQILLEVAVAYLDLIGAEARLEILRRGETEIAEIVRITGEFARTGQGKPSDANRSLANAELVRRQFRQAEGTQAVASARLTRLLNLNPATTLKTPGGEVELLTLVDANTELETLLTTALRNRPELLARTAEISEAQVRVRQEKTRPLLPTLSVGYSATGFGGGNTSTGSLATRSDVDVVAVWSFENLGLGNRARVRNAGAIVGQTVSAYEAAVNQVRSEVASAQANAQAATQQCNTALAAVTAAGEGYKLERDRTMQGEGLPIEGLDSFRQLLDARQELLRAVIAANAAQFRLLIAIGNQP
ncbi:N/A [soil metagenome]